METVFYDGGITGPESFLTFATDHNIELQSVCHDNEVVGLVWLNNPQGKACMIHFCIFRKFWEHQRIIGLWTVHMLLGP